MMNPLFHILPPTLVLGGVFSFLRQRFGRLKSAWRRFAQAHALKFKTSWLSGEPSVSGTYERHRISVTVVPPGKGNNGFTRFKLDFYSPLQLDLKLTTENGEVKVLKFLGMTDHEMGDRNFDDAVVVAGHSIDEVRQFLTGERRRKLLGFFQSSFRAKVTRKGLTYQVPGMAGSEAMLEEGLSACVDAAKALEG